MPFGGKQFIDKPDVSVIHWGFRYTATLGGSLLTGPWRGGTFVRFIDSWTVDRAGPLDSVGFLHKSSAQQEGSEFLRAKDPQETLSISVLRGGAYDFLFFETESVNLRRAKQGLPPLPAPALPAQNLTYAINDPLYVSSNGLLTNEMEVTGAERVAFTTAVPDNNQGFLGAILA